MGAFPWDDWKAKVYQKVFGDQTPPPGVPPTATPPPLPPVQPENADPYGVQKFLQDKAREREQTSFRAGIGISPVMESAVMAAWDPYGTLMDLGLSRTKLPGMGNVNLSNLVPGKRNLLKAGAGAASALTRAKPASLLENVVETTVKHGAGTGRTAYPLTDAIVERQMKENTLLDKIIRASEQQTEKTNAERLAAGLKVLPKGTLDTPEKLVAAQGRLLKDAGIYLDDTPRIDRATGTLQADKPVSRSMARLLQQRILHDTPGTGELATGSPLYERTHPMELSTRQPTSVKSVEDPIRELLITSFENMKKGDSFTKNIEKMTEYPYFKALKGLPPEEAAEKMLDFMTSNLLYLHDQAKPEHRDRSKLWYDGARKIVEQWSQGYGVEEPQVAGVLAVFSPQKDWYMNVDMGRRLLDFWGNREQQAWHPDMDTIGWTKVLAAKQAEAKNAAKKKGEGEEADEENFALEETYADIQGKSFAELTDPYEKALWFRLHDEGLNPREHRIVTPEGDFGGYVMKNPIKSGKRKGEQDPAGMAWSSYGPIMKAMSILEDGRLENISQQMGREHKIRNFYNNMLLPNSPNGHVTADTHAVAAAGLSPYSGSSIPVLHNFKSGASSSKMSGEQGTYGINAEAYRRAAKARGLTAREMQSITWEAVRGLFTDDFKRDKVNTSAIERIWHAYSDGKITLDEARQHIFTLANGINDPTWAGTPAQSTIGGSNPGPDGPQGQAVNPQGVSPVRLPRANLGLSQTAAPGVGGASPGGVPVGQPAGKPGAVPAQGKPPGLISPKKRK